MKKTFFLCALSISPLLMSAPAQAEETREAVRLNEQQHDWVLEYMRRMLETVSDMQGHLATGNTEKVAEQATSVRSFARNTKPRGIGKQFPAGFKSMARQMNASWTELATPTDDAAQISATTQKLLNSCNACHRVYYLPPVTPGGALIE
ncbi:MAG: hypothetical protein CMI02_13870 [Oceanospirillaceae bacterium]|nr:hypothetical protein [Oceanospirillaceae bacterium]MBT13110.1 hypothetical protein [Oceanospirillaceae bacterium]|tara:strand:- start:23073 stop:23519 length:447 start_codon:yes stop_codon:yes gene_type:complete